ncbi:ketopantoate reductase family protein [Mameliella alba]|uniref:2-dehydropantoate 2-reductase n=1 Tax=Mameliella alba TaxID=561184 RepID=A0A0B3SVU9_9RHOB|nr:2-dehydropantoate 2-reductase N-terminal domain-containing protein [Mameliella alba]KHQ54564.1 Ketopantoate reductase ApbA/PanE-like protein [Mameliella alba]
MRVVIFGVGAVGGVVGAALALAGHEVIGVARGRRLAAVREKGLLLRGHQGEKRVPLDLVEQAAELTPRDDDMILLATKSQDSAAALGDLRSAGYVSQPVFCMQNGVANEDLALRFFDNVHGINVMLPAEYLASDEAICFGRPNYGVFDIGRYPGGSDAADQALAEALTGAGIRSFVTDAVMENKFGKLIVNLGNIVEAALGRGVKAPEITSALRQEAETVFRAAGVSWQDMGEGDPRRGTLLEIAPIEGIDRAGNSTTQSFLRGAGSVETDYLNGEVALIARRNGGHAPLNAAITALAARLARGGAAAGGMTPEALAAELGM